jgi:hypothetical protein
MTKDNQPQGMGELLARQRSGTPLTPAQAARQRRSGQDAPVTRAGQPAGPGLETASEAGKNARVKGGLAEIIGEASSQPQPIRPAVADHPAVPTSARPTFARITSHRGTLLAAACSVAIALACYLLASRRRAG